MLLKAKTFVRAPAAQMAIILDITSQDRTKSVVSAAPASGGADHPPDGEATVEAAAHTTLPMGPRGREIPRIVRGTRPPPLNAAQRVEPVEEELPQETVTRPVSPSASDSTMQVKTTLFSPGPSPAANESEPVAQSPRERRGTIGGHAAARAGQPREATDEAGVMLGKYHLLRHLASGGMAHIFLARLDGVGGFSRHMVVKTLRRRHAHDPAHVAMFLDEARLLSALHHRNIAKVSELGVTEDGTHFLAMEYIHGEPVRHVLQQTRNRGLRIPLDFALTVVHSGALALQHVHERHGSDGRWLNMVHRDVSPSNLMAGYDGSVTLIDFGIAKATVRTAHTPVGVIKGKLGYMAPEQSLGENVDRRSDVFSLGVVLYELTTQQHPFSAKTSQEVRMRVMRGDVTPPSQIIPGYPRGLEQVVLKAIARQPSDRFVDCEQFAQALLDVGAQVGIAPSPAAVSRLLSQLFGDRVEPWFDGAGEGGPLSVKPTAAKLLRRSTAVPNAPKHVPRAASRAASRAAQSRPVELVSQQELQRIVDDAQAEAWKDAAVPVPVSSGAITVPRTHPGLTTPLRNLPSHPPEPLRTAASFTPPPFAIPTAEAPNVASIQHRYDWPPEPAYVGAELPNDLPDADLWSPASLPGHIQPARRNLAREVGEMLAVAVALGLMVLSNLNLTGGSVRPGADRGVTPAVRPPPLAQAPRPAAPPVSEPTTTTRPASPQPAPTSFTLSVMSEPSDATVILDGERLGRTPLFIALPMQSGPGELKLRRRGYRTHREEIELGTDRTVEIKLRSTDEPAEEEPASTDEVERARGDAEPARAAERDKAAEGEPREVDDAERAVDDRDQGAGSSDEPATGPDSEPTPRSLDEL
jgi:eukaryotic-like serine/threonine-protein kinase